jgi:hypothetical protein
LVVKKPADSAAKSQQAIRLQRESSGLHPIVRRSLVTELYSKACGMFVGITIAKTKSNEDEFQ